MALKSIRAGRSREKTGRNRMTPVMRHRKTGQNTADLPGLTQNFDDPDGPAFAGRETRSIMDIEHDAHGKQVTEVTPFGIKE